MEIASADECLISAAWPKIESSWQNTDIEKQFSLYQASLGELREIRNSQNIGNKTEVKFSIKCEPSIANALRPLVGYFVRMANAELVDMGAEISTAQYQRDEDHSEHGDLRRSERTDRC